MSITGGPDISENGLVLYLDASNRRSYPGSGTTWSDLSGNGNTGTLINGPTFDNGNGGSITFDGIDDYGSINQSTTNKPLNALTVCVFIYPRQSSYSNCRIVGDWHQSLTNDRWIFFSPDSTVSWYMKTTTTSDGGTSGYTIQPNKWVYLVGTYNGSTQDFYVNGQYFSQRTNVTGVMNDGDGNRPIRFGKQGDQGGGFDGYIGQISIYSRALSNTEILQNYNATRSRFGV